MYPLLTGKKQILFSVQPLRYLFQVWSSHCLTCSLIIYFFSWGPFNVGINLNVLVQKNIHHILNNEQKCMEHCLSWYKSILLLSFVSYIAFFFVHRFLNLSGNFKIGVACKRLAYKKRANSNLIADRSN